MSKRLTVGELKKKLEDIPDYYEVDLWSDTGLDQCEIVVEDVYPYAVDKMIMIYANIVEKK